MCLDRPFGYSVYVRFKKHEWLLQAWLLLMVSDWLAGEILLKKKQRSNHVCLVCAHSKTPDCWGFSVRRPWVSQWHSVQHLIQKLQGTVQVDLHPAGSVFDALTGVVRPPAFHEAEPQDTESPQVIDANACCCRETCQWTGRGRG